MGLGRVSSLLALAAVFGCADEAPVPSPVPVAAPVPSGPAHGGSLVALRAHRLELKAHRSGEVFAYLTRPDGSPAPSSESGLLTVTLTVDDDHPRPVLLRWNADERRYEVRLRQEPLEGPADVQLMVGGAVERGSIDRLPIDEVLAESGVAYAEAEESIEDEEEVDDEAVEEEPESGGSGGGGIRARARRLFGF